MIEKNLAPNSYLFIIYHSHKGPLLPYPTEFCTESKSCHPPLDLPLGGPPTTQTVWQLKLDLRSLGAQVIEETGNLASLDPGP
jgi:hypothetical protein